MPKSVKKYMDSFIYQSLNTPQRFAPEKLPGKFWLARFLVILIAPEGNREE